MRISGRDGTVPPTTALTTARWLPLWLKYCVVPEFLRYLFWGVWRLLMSIALVVHRRNVLAGESRMLTVLLCFLWGLWRVLLWAEMTVHRCRLWRVQLRCLAEVRPEAAHVGAAASLQVRFRCVHRLFGPSRGPTWAILVGQSGKTQATYR